MKTTVSIHDFRNAFKNYNREANFSYAGQTALFDYLTEYEDSTGEELEMDIIALCCEFSEYEDMEEFHKNYDAEEYPDLNTLRDYTTVIEFGNNSFIIQDF
jgi:hypothetical protein